MWFIYGIRYFGLYGFFIIWYDMWLVGYWVWFGI